MTVQGNNIIYGSFTSDGNARTLILPSLVDRFVITNRTLWGSGPAGKITKSEWSRGMPAGWALNTGEAAGNDLYATKSTVNGFTEINPLNIPTFAATTITAITQANPAQITSATHGLQPKDLVVLNNITGMQQISGWVFEVKSVIDASNFTIDLDSSGFAAAGTGGTVRKIDDPLDFFPQHNYISSITKAVNCVVRVTWTDPSINCPIGSKWRFNVPASSGMVEINGRLGTVLAVNDTDNTVTFDIDTTGFTTFALPASGSVPYTFPQITPVGEINTTLLAAVTNDGFLGLRLGTDVVGENGNVMDWIALKGVTI